MDLVVLIEIYSHITTLFMMSSVIYGVVHYRALSKIHKGLVWYIVCSLFIDLSISFPMLMGFKYEPIFAGLLKLISRLIDFLILLSFTSFLLLRNKNLFWIGSLTVILFLQEIVKVAGNQTYVDLIPYSSIFGNLIVCIGCITTIIKELRDKDASLEVLYASGSVFFYSIMLVIFFVVQNYLMNQIAHKPNLIYFYFSYTTIVLIFHIVIFIQLWKSGKTPTHYLR